MVALQLLWPECAAAMDFLPAAKDEQNYFAW